MCGCVGVWVCGRVRVSFFVAVSHLLPPSSLLTYLCMQCNLCIDILLLRPPALRVVPPVPPERTQAGHL